MFLHHNNRNGLKSSFRKVRDEEIKNNPEKNFNISLTYTSRRCESVAQKLMKCIKKVTPDFRINWCWRTIKMSSITSPKLKNKVPTILKNGAIYKFTCAKECQKTYIGETKRLLKTRISEHFQPSRKSAIRDHTDECKLFKKSLNKKLSEKPNSKPAERNRIRTDHIQNHFSPMAFNTNYFKRTTIEALMISLYEPELNEQVVHKKTFLL